MTLPRTPRRAFAERATEAGWLFASAATIGLLTLIYVWWLHLSHATIVALSFLLIVLVVAAVSTLWVAIATSVLSFLCFNFFFLPPVGTWTIADPLNWVALFTLLAVSIIASHLSTQARRRAQEAVRLLEERKEEEVLRRSAELRSALLASLSHGLKTPLTAMTVAANNLKTSWLSEDQRREQTEVLLAELERLNRLFQNVVDMARIETRAIAPEPEWVQPAEIIEAAARRTEASLGEHRLQIDVPNENIFVRLDPRLTSAALAHVLENAAQYSPAGSTITVRAVLADDELQIWVHDEGPGIAPHDLDRLFDRFYRGAAAREYRFGTGMGLAITRGLLAAQRGRVQAGNDAAGGAVFTIVVPAESRRATALDGEAV